VSCRDNAACGFRPYPDFDLGLMAKAPDLGALELPVSAPVLSEPFPTL
jgi:hypothetical protein